MHGGHSDTFMAHRIAPPPTLYSHFSSSLSQHSSLSMPFRAPLLLSPWGVASSLSVSYQLPLAFPSSGSPPPLYPSPRPLSPPSMCLPFTKFHSKQPSRTIEKNPKEEKRAKQPTKMCELANQYWNIAFHLHFFRLSHFVNFFGGKKKGDF